MSGDISGNFSLLAGWADFGKDFGKCGPPPRDALLAYCREMRPFESHTEEYKEKRAVAAFNAAQPMLQEYKRLKPNAEAAVCHVASCIVPRQVRCMHAIRMPPHHTLTSLVFGLLRADDGAW